MCACVCLKHAQGNGSLCRNMSEAKKDESGDVKVMMKMIRFYMNNIDCTHIQWNKVEIVM